MGYCTTAFNRGVKMKVITWKAVLTILNPSPIFAAVASFAEMLAVNGDGFDPKKSYHREEKACHKNQH
jgi:hypothetical protein